MPLPYQRRPDDNNFGEGICIELVYWGLLTLHFVFAEAPGIFHRESE